MSVVLLRRACPAEDNTRSNRIGSLDVGVVETLDVLRQFLHPESRTEFLKDTVAVFVRVGVLLLLEGIEAHLLCIPGAQLKQGELVSPDRNPELHVLYLKIRHERHQDLARKHAELGANLSDEHPEHRLRSLVHNEPESEIEGLHHSSPSDSQEVTESLGTFAYQGEHIHIACRGIDNHRLAVVVLDGLHLLLVFIRLLEIEVFRRLHHQTAVVLDDFTASATQQPYYFLDIVLILLLRNSPDAAASAFPDVKVQAGTELVPQDGI